MTDNSERQYEILGGSAPSDKTHKAIEVLNELTQEDFSKVLEKIYSDQATIRRTVGISADEDISIVDRIKSIGIQGEEAEIIRGFFLQVSRGVAKYDTTKRKIESELTNLGLAEDKRDTLVESLKSHKSFIRSSLISASTIQTAPELIDVGWNILVQKETEAVEGVNKNRILLSLSVFTGDEIDSIEIEMSEEDLTRLLSSLGQAHHSLQDYQTDVDLDLDLFEDD